MVTRLEHYGLRVGHDTMTPKEAAERFRRFEVARADMIADVGRFTTEDFYGERGNRKGWVWCECTGAESDV